MTKEEAIKVLKEYRTMVMNCLEAEVPAFDLAIESLSADTVSRSQYQGLLNAIGKVYVEVVRCKDCRWYDNRYGEVCHNPRYGDGHANYSPPYVDEEYWCKDGKRREK